jgi:hypothetical protein
MSQEDKRIILAVVAPFMIFAAVNSNAAGDYTTAIALHQRLLRSLT